MKAQSQSLKFAPSGSAQVAVNYGSTLTGAFSNGAAGVKSPDPLGQSASTKAQSSSNDSGNSRLSLRRPATPDAGNKVDQEA